MSNKSKARTRVEKYPLPTTADGICSLMREILLAGSVQRIELDVNLPVRVVRGLSDAETGLDEEVDLDGSLRNLEMVEYTSEGAGPFQTLFDMMQLIHVEKLIPTCWVTGEGVGHLLSEWLELRARGMPSGTEHLVGLPVHRVKMLPEDTLLLCGSPYPNAGFDELTMAIKTAIEIRRPSNDKRRTTPSSETDGAVWSDPNERNSTTHQLAAPARGLRKVEWKPPSEP